MVHYEVYGRGKPVILLHGWLGSWGLWQETMAYLGAFYRTYALDFWGFGESGKKRETYAVAGFCQSGESIHGATWELTMRLWWDIAWAVQ